MIINHPRAEYKQLLLAAKYFLAKVESPKFVKPSRYNHSRWMKQLIQLIYIYVFRDEWHSRQYPLEDIEKLCLFGVKIYLKFWFECTVARFAPLNDLNMFKSFSRIDDKGRNGQIKHVCLDTFELHNFYVNGKLVALAFFDERISIEYLRQMVSSLQKDPPQNFSINPETMLIDLVNRSYLDFFRVSELPHDFLKDDPADWRNSDSFIYCQDVICSLQVVNDTTERTISAAKQYSNILTKDNSNLTNILHSVQANISSRQKPTKSAYQTPYKAD